MCVIWLMTRLLIGQANGGKKTYRNLVTPWRRNDTRYGNDSIIDSASRNLIAQ